MTAPTPGQAAYEALETQVRAAIASAGRCTAKPGTCSFCDEIVTGVLRTADAYAIAAQERPAPDATSELAMLRADLADVEVLLAKWPRCPSGCNCRIGIDDDADRNECGCDGPCNGGEQPAPVVTGYGPTADAIRAEVDADNAKDKLIAELRGQVDAVKAIVRDKAAAQTLPESPSEMLARAVLGQLEES